MAKEVAIKKRALIDKASRNMFIAVCGASLVFGFSIVGAVYLIKWMAFNAKVIGEKQVILKDYDTSLKNLAEVNSKVLALADNASLEVVARGEGCVGSTEEEQDLIDGAGISSLDECTALRVVPDALPAVRNQEALLASLNKIFIISGIEPESLAPGDGFGGGTAPAEGVGVLPVSLVVEGNGRTVKDVLSNIERSIRAFDVRTAVIAWRSDGDGSSDSATIMLRGQASAYFSAEIVAAKQTKTITASGNAASSTTTGGTQ
jgi:hypothetical protein